jgi:transcriptional regulator with XRE-family HTH domain
MPTNEENDRRKIGRRLRDMRDYLGLSQDEVARALKMSRPAISLIESGDRKVDALELKRFADLYQQSVDHFITESSDSPGSKEVSLLLRAPRDVTDLARTASKLSPADRVELARFAEFLRTKPKAP